MKIAGEFLKWLANLLLPIHASSLISNSFNINYSNSEIEITRLLVKINSELEKVKQLMGVWVCLATFDKLFFLQLRLTWKTALGLTYEMQIRAVWKTVKTINPFCFNWETLTGQGSRLGDLGFWVLTTIVQFTVKVGSITVKDRQSFKFEKRLDRVLLNFFTHFQEKWLLPIAAFRMEQLPRALKINPKSFHFFHKEGKPL